MTQINEHSQVFSDTKVGEGGQLMFDACLLGSPRPRVIWLFEGRKLPFHDVEVRLRRL